MKQIVRRATYSLFGVAPACLGVAYASMLGPFVIAALAGAIGLLILMVGAGRLIEILYVVPHK